MKKNKARSAPFPRKVVFVLGDLKFGGTQRQVLHLGHLLDKSKFHVEVWLMAGDDELAPLARGWGIPLVWLSRRRGVSLTGVVNLGRQIRRSRPHMLILFTHLPNIWGCLWGYANRIPVIVGTCRSGTPRFQHERWLWPLTDHLISNCASVADKLTRQCRVPKEHITTIPNGVDTEYFRPPSVRSGPPVVLSVGRLVSVKAHDILINAFAVVLARHPQAELWLVGNGPRLGELKELVRHRLPPGKARFLLPRTDISPLYRQASLFALSSINEAMPNVVLEAMACGLPIVASAAGGVQELVAHGQTGCLVPPGDPAALAKALDSMLNDQRHREAMGKAGRERAEGEFSLTAMVRGHERVFERLAKKVEKDTIFN